MLKDYYHIFDLSPSASRHAIKEQWLLLLHAWHPDKFKNEQQRAKAERKTQEINEAYAVLGDPLRRQQYDRLYASLAGCGPHARHNRAGYSVQGSNQAMGRYLHVVVESLVKNKRMDCDAHCLWFHAPERCLNKANVSLDGLHATHLRYTEAVLAIQNVFEYELYVSFESSCFLVDGRGNLYKRKYLFCDAFLRDKTRYLHTGEWLEPGKRALFLLSFPELSGGSAISEITFHQTLYAPGFQIGKMRDKEVYNIAIV